MKNSFLSVYKLYRKYKRRLSPSVQDEIRQALSTAQESLLKEDSLQSQRDVGLLEQLAKRYLQKNSLDRVRDWIGALIFALVVAVLVRQMWFEFYEIPTGSMRPTFAEQDRLVVSKDQFGLNIPLTAKHFYFDPSLVQRGGVIVFTGKDMDIPDVNTRYFYLFPGKKQYIKRMIGKPGDTLYFYGGRIYGIDKNGVDISHELQPALLDKIDHVPFISFEGKPLFPSAPVQGVFSSVILYQMNEPVAKLSLSPSHQVEGSMLPKTHVKTYGDLWGFHNYAMARILSKKDYFATLHGADVEELSPSEYYLELTHNPSLATAKLQRDLYGRFRPMLGLSRSYIPLDVSLLEKLFNNLYTARFTVDSSGFVQRYGYKKHTYPQSFLPKLPGVPAGTYEFYYGKAYQILWQGIAKELPSSHPIYQFTPDTLYTLFNLGIEFDNRFLPMSKYPLLQPSRYAFFREGSLYVMGTPLFDQGSPILAGFLEQELLKAKKSLPHTPYTPFIDYGVPSKETILAQGITVPEKSYLVLGDNYAMSADSREFGFVPEGNLRGVPEFIFWPPGERFGMPKQEPYPFLTLPTVIVWVLAAGIITGYVVVQRRRYRLPIHIS